MISWNYRRVLVLGAGASCPYGFPMGAALLTRLQEYDESLWQMLADCGFKHCQYVKFIRALSCQEYSSIDEFLIAQEEHREIGKAALASTLIRLERPERLETDSTPSDWYTSFLSTRNWSCDDALSREWNIPFIITFNYDRSLEYATLRYSREVLGRSPGIGRITVERDSLDLVAEAFVIDCMPILHVYGHLGVLPQFDSPGGMYGVRRDYDPTVDVSSIRAAREEIKLIGDAAISMWRVMLAQSAIRCAKRIDFIGFGFHQSNCALLFPPHMCVDPEINLAATAYGESMTRREEMMLTLPENDDDRTAIRSRLLLHKPHVDAKAFVEVEMQA